MRGPSPGPAANEPIARARAEVCGSHVERGAAQGCPREKRISARNACNGLSLDMANIVAATQPV